MSELSGFAAGIFYPDNRNKLEERLKEAFAVYTNTDDSLTELPAALFIPHAAYDFMLQPAAAAFQTVSHLSPARVLLLSPLHSEVLQEDSPSFLFFPASHGCRSPLGPLPFDRSTAETLAFAVEEGWAAAADSYFEEEPSWELALPFVQFLFPEAGYFPVLYGGNSAKQASHLARIITEVVSDSTLLIISSNAAVWHEPSQGEEQAHRLTDILSSPTDGKRPPLLDLARKKLITACGTSLFDALYRSHCFTRPWTILSEPVTADETAKLREHSWFSSGAVELTAIGEN